MGRFSFHNVENVLCLNSWTSAAEIILRWFGITDGDEIIIPVTTYCATYIGNIYREYIGNISLYPYTP